ncbi:MAG: Na-translocating system protein MpsC family protein [Isosphaeraceae bacterium]
MKTQGEIEAAICEGITRFEQEDRGRGPRDIRAHLLGDLLLVRLQSVLTAAEHYRQPGCQPSPRCPHRHW